jgi:hypothetical protein
MLNALKKFWPVLVGGSIVAAVLAMLYVFSLGPDGHSSFENAGAAQPHQAAVPVEATTLDGAYVGESNGVDIRASIEGKTIVVTMTNEGTTITYWRGSFDNLAPVGTNVGSVADNTVALLSQSNTKEFTVGDRTISYTMTMMGVSRQIELHHV